MNTSTVLKEGEPSLSASDRDEAQIRGFTLMFDDSDLEVKWNLTRIKRHINMTTRYSFAAACFQGLFYWGDWLEFNGGSLLHIASIRLILGVSCLLVCFLVSTGLLVPTQVILWWMNICYGVPTLALFYFAKTTVSQWDCLFLIYGLSFFVLPKMSPLNFIFGFSGASTLSFLFIYISAYRLSLQQWFLSNIILTLITAMFCYISYSYERGSRERWLLRERLHRERINFRIISSSVQDDINRTVNDDRPFPLDPIYSKIGYNTLGYRDRGGPIMRYFGSSFNSFKRTLMRASRMKVKSSENIAGMSSGASSSSLGDDYDGSKPIVITKEERLTLFFRGLGAWALCFGMGYALDIEEINRSAAFALLVHSMGFSVFLMVFTGQVRWLALNGIVALSMLWIFNQTGMDNKWVVFSTHTVGYVVLAVVLVVMVLVFGGVVLVWSHLIEFLKEVLVRYPQLKEDLNSAEDKVLEQVLIKYISDLPRSESVFSSSGGEGKVLELYQERPTFADGSVDVFDSNSHNRHPNPISAVTASRTINNPMPNLPHLKGLKNAAFPSKSRIGVAAATVTQPVSTCSSRGGEQQKLKTIKMALETGKEKSEMTSESRFVLQPKRKGCCYFCLKPEQTLLLPACSGWDTRHPDTVHARPDKDTTDAASASVEGSKNNGGSLPMCTPYTEMIKERDEAIDHRNLLQQEIMALRLRSQSLEVENKDALSRMQAFQRRVHDLDATVLKQEEACAARIREEQRRRDDHVQSVLSQHNQQLSELKRLHKALLQQASAASAANAQTGMTLSKPDKQMRRQKETEKSSSNDQSGGGSHQAQKQQGPSLKSIQQQQLQQSLQAKSMRGRVGSHDANSSASLRKVIAPGAEAAVLSVLQKPLDKVDEAGRSDAVIDLDGFGTQKTISGSNSSPTLRDSSSFALTSVRSPLSTSRSLQFDCATSVDVSSSLQQQQFEYFNDEEQRRQRSFGSFGTMSTSFMSTAARPGAEPMNAGSNASDSTLAFNLSSSFVPVSSPSNTLDPLDTMGTLEEMTRILSTRLYYPDSSTENHLFSQHYNVPDPFFPLEDPPGYSLSSLIPSKFHVYEAQSRMQQSDIPNDSVGIPSLPQQQGSSAYIFRHAFTAGATQAQIQEEDEGCSDKQDADEIAFEELSDLIHSSHV